MPDFFSLLTWLDVKLLFFINHFRSPFLDYLMVKVSDFDLFAPFIGAFILFRLYKGDNRERIFWLLGITAIILGDALCARVLKPLFARPRPYLSLDGVFVYKDSKWLLTTPELRAHFSMSFSWPSCHATNIWTATSYCAGYRLKYGLFLLPLAILVSLSRSYLGVHYPLDCLGGLVIGALLGISFSFLMKKFWVKLKI